MLRWVRRFGAALLALGAAATFAEAPPAALDRAPDPFALGPGDTTTRVDELAEIRGLVKARSEAVLASQLEGRILELPFEAGDRFEAGDTLVAFDCNMYQARLGAARAQWKGAEKKHANDVELAQLDAVSQIELELSAAEAERTAAEVEMARVEVRRCTIRAPWPGRVVSRAVNPFESVSANQELLSILDDSELEIELIVPSRWLTWLAPGAKFRFQVDETGREYPVQVARIGAAADPVSQTIRVEAVFPGDPLAVLAGMSGTAHFEQPVATGRAGP